MITNFRVFTILPISFMMGRAADLNFVNLLAHSQCVVVI